MKKLIAFILISASLLSLLITLKAYVQEAIPFDLVIVAEFETPYSLQICGEIEPPHCLQIAVEHL